MSTNSSIEWTETTWNPVTGCSKLSPGCANCYAERLTRRLKGMGHPNYANGFEVTTHEHMLGKPLEWPKPHTVFVNSMSDLFHENVPLDFIVSVFDIMERAYWHTFQILTKRSERLVECSEQLVWPDNVWMGVSVENRDYLPRIRHLNNTHAKVKFVSFEPLLAPIGQVNFQGLDWVIVGGESGPGARPMEEQWVLEIMEQCADAHIPFFFKQWGGNGRKKKGRQLLGREWDQMPCHARVG